jgi:hypothetical protein
VYSQLLGRQRRKLRSLGPAWANVAKPCLNNNNNIKTNKQKPKRKEKQKKKRTQGTNSSSGRVFT